MIRYDNAEWLKNISTPYGKRKNAIPDRNDSKQESEPQGFL